MSEHVILIRMYRENVSLPFLMLVHRMNMAMLFSIKQATKRITRTARRMFIKSEVSGSVVGMNGGMESSAVPVLLVSVSALGL